jgi:hypothetical protein
MGCGTLVKSEDAASLRDQTMEQPEIVISDGA